ncbi:MAG TPA: competence/damage-inducible protein A [Bryobacteraceae bacterium]|nr:competence/damage-inducible protein A [Bryobacteraceae bacterium]
MPDAEIIAVGSEMLTSQRIDTNSLYLADQLNALGVEVRRKLIVGDDRTLLTAAVRQALEYAGIVILTGGLGPTEDDVTRESVAAALGRPLAFHQEISDAIEERFRRRQRKMAEINKRQAYAIEGAQILPNTNGTAPGQWIEHEGRLVILLPGPPGELKPMFAGECLPRLIERLPRQVIRTRFYRVTGLTESDLDALIAPVYTRYANPSTTILASPGDIQIHLRARCESAEQAERLLAEVAAPIEDLLGKHLFSRNGDPLEAIVGTLLREHEATLSIAESCTGGMVGERITSVPGSSNYFLGGFITYSDLLKTELLGVDPAVIEKHSAVSKEVACAMAEGARARTGATFALSITGEAGPESSSGVPVGTVFVGFAGPDKTEAIRFAMPGDRPRIRGFATQAALDLLRRRLLKLD